MPPSTVDSLISSPGVTMTFLNLALLLLYCSLLAMQLSAAASETDGSAGGQSASQSLARIRSQSGKWKRVAIKSGAAVGEPTTKT